MRRWPLGFLVLALTGLAGCGGEPPVEPLLMISGPEAFLSFELRDGRDEVLWRLTADEPTPLATLVYGEVPAGFRQEAPPGGGAPRELLAGEPLVVESVTPRRTFRHEGFAAGSRGLSIDRWEMRLRDPPPLDGPTPEP